jgi:uncharacterized protein
MTDQQPTPPEGPPSGYGSPPPPGPYPPPGYGPPTYQGYPPSAMAPSDERTWAMFAHVGALLAAAVAMAFLGPLIILLVQGSKSPFVRRHAVESLNFQITLLIALAVGVVLSVVTIGLGLIVVIPAALGISLAALILIIMASVAANKGEDYRYPMTIRLVK